MPLSFYEPLVHTCMYTDHLDLLREVAFCLSHLYFLTAERFSIKLGIRTHHDLGEDMG